MVTFRTAQNRRPPSIPSRRLGVSPGKARHIRPPRLRWYAHRCVGFVHRQGISAPSPCPPVARSARGPAGGRVRFAGGGARPLGGGGLGGGGVALLGRLPPSGALEPPSGPTGAPPSHTWALPVRGGGGDLSQGRPHLPYYRVHLAGAERGGLAQRGGQGCRARGEPSSF